jgi:hypothetical protein
MSDWPIRGFQDDWRPQTLRRPRGAGPRIIAPSAAEKARLARLVLGMPEAFFRQTGKPTTRKVLSEHLRYISRNGALPLETPEEQFLIGRPEVDDLAQDWTFVALHESRRRSISPLARAFVLAAPPGSDPEATRRAGRAFAHERLGETFDFAFALHIDKPYPHVHLVARALGRKGERLNLGPADAQNWREHFAAKLREQGVEAQATFGSERGRASLHEPFAVRKMREAYERNEAPCPELVKRAYAEAGEIMHQERVAATPAESRVIAKNRAVRENLEQSAALLQQSADPADRMLGEAVARYAANLPTPTSRRVLLAQQLREVWEAEQADSRRAWKPPHRDGIRRERER